MSGNQECIVIDTNVWLDNYIPHRAGHADAQRLLACARSCDVQLLYAVESVKDVFYVIAADFKATVRAQAGHVGDAEEAVAQQLAWSCVENMRTLANAIGADESDVWLAAKYRSLHGDLEDNLVLAATKRAGADYLVTGDRAFIEKATVPALTPRDWLVLHEAER